MSTNYFTSEEHGETVGDDGLNGCPLCSKIAGLSRLRIAGPLRRPSRRRKKLLPGLESSRC
jgi:hypothetical protein